MAEFKAQFNYESRLKLEENLPLDSPLVVYVEPSSFCNLECKFCPQHNGRGEFPTFNMSLKTFQKTLDDISTFNTKPSLMRFCGIGDPLFNKEISEINDMIKQKYVYGEDASNWENICTEWKKDCDEQGCQGINLMINALKILPQEVIKNRVIKMAGLDREEELLVLAYSKKGTNMLCSLTNEKYKRMVGDICSPECSLDYKKKGKSLVFTFIKDEKKVIEVDIPFTFNANGAWHRPAKYEGTQFHQKEGVELAWGDRRPKKSKELATSTNTYMSIKPYF